jgi:hypothetical protein
MPVSASPCPSIWSSCQLVIRYIGEIYWNLKTPNFGFNGTTIKEEILWEPPSLSGHSSIVTRKHLSKRKAFSPNVVWSSLSPWQSLPPTPLALYANADCKLSVGNTHLTRFAGRAKWRWGLQGRLPLSLPLVSAVFHHHHHNLLQYSGYSTRVRIAKEVRLSLVLTNLALHLEGVWGVDE